jgi:hypothetical protein
MEVVARGLGVLSPPVPSRHPPPSLPVTAMTAPQACNISRVANNGLCHAVWLMLGTAP